MEIEMEIEMNKEKTKNEQERQREGVYLQKFKNKEEGKYLRLTGGIKKYER